MRTFKLGQRVRLTLPTVEVKTGAVVMPRGATATVIGLPGASPKYPDYYIVDIDGYNPGPMKKVAARADYMRPLLPDSDTYHKSTWDDFNETIQRPEVSHA